MQVIVELNTAREVMWSLPGSSPLTLSTPRASIETDKLTTQQKEILYKAIKSGKVTSSTHPDEFFRVNPAPNKKEAKSDTVLEALQKKLAEENNAAASTAKNILGAPVNLVKKELTKVRDLKTLRIMLALESGSKNRPGVITAIQKAIQDESEAISSAAKQPDSTVVLLPADPARVAYPGGTIDYDVVESEQTTIQVKIPSKE